MDELYYITDPEGKKKLRDLFISMGGDADWWDNRFKRREGIESLGEIDYWMRKPTKWGKRRPG